MVMIFDGGVVFVSMALSVLILQYKIYGAGGFRSRPKGFLLPPKLFRTQIEVKPLIPIPLLLKGSVGNFEPFQNAACVTLNL